MRQRYHFVAIGYVVMPEHFHLLISEPEIGTPSTAMQAIKLGFARRVLDLPSPARSIGQEDIPTSRAKSAREMGHPNPQTTLQMGHPNPKSAREMGHPTYPIASGSSGSMTSTSGGSARRQRNSATCTRIRSTADWCCVRKIGTGAAFALTPVESLDRFVSMTGRDGRNEFGRASRNLGRKNPHFPPQRSREMGHPPPSPSFFHSLM